MSIISLSLPTELLEEFNAILGEEKNATRSEVLRQAVRNYITEYRKLDKIKGEVIATITIFYERKNKTKNYSSCNMNLAT